MNDVYKISFENLRKFIRSLNNTPKPDICVNGFSEIFLEIFNLREKTSLNKKKSKLRIFFLSKDYTGKVFGKIRKGFIAVYSDTEDVILISRNAYDYINILGHEAVHRYVCKFHKLDRIKNIYINNLTNAFSTKSENIISPILKEIDSKLLIELKKIRNLDKIKELTKELDKIEELMKEKEKYKKLLDRIKNSDKNTREMYINYLSKTALLNILEEYSKGSMKFIKIFLENFSLRVLTKENISLFFDGVDFNYIEDSNLQKEFHESFEDLLGFVKRKNLTRYVEILEKKYKAHLKKHGIGSKEINLIFSRKVLEEDKYYETNCFITYYCFKELFDKIKELREFILKVIEYNYFSFYFKFLRTFYPKLSENKLRLLFKHFAPEEIRAIETLDGYNEALAYSIEGTFPNPILFLDFSIEEGKIKVKMNPELRKYYVVHVIEDGPLEFLFFRRLVRTIGFKKTLDVMFKDLTNFLNKKFFGKKFLDLNFLNILRKKLFKTK